MCVAPSGSTSCCLSPPPAPLRRRAGGGGAVAGKVQAAGPHRLHLPVAPAPAGCRGPAVSQVGTWGGALCHRGSCRAPACLPQHLAAASRPAGCRVSAVWHGGLSFAGQKFGLHSAMHYPVAVVSDRPAPATPCPACSVSGCGVLRQVLLASPALRELRAAACSRLVVRRQGGDGLGLSTRAAQHNWQGGCRAAHNTLMRDADPPRQLLQARRASGQHACCK